MLCWRATRCACTSWRLFSTQRLYLNDMSLLQHSATVVGVSECGEQVMLDASVFHPQGGGQPSDAGALTRASDGAVFEVAKAVVGKGGADVAHIGAGARLQVGDAVTAAIDGERRKLHSVLHSAGHAVDVALASVGARDGQDDVAALVPTKGYHFPDGPKVTYAGVLAPERRLPLVGALQAALDALVAADIPTVVKDVRAAEVDPLYAGTGFPDAQESVRVVGVGGELFCPCGGTHVSSTAALGAVVIKKIGSKKGETKVYYDVAD